MTRLLNTLPSIAGLAIAGSLLLAALMAAMLFSGAPPVSAADDDGDGFDTAVEIALGSDPFDPTSTPEHLFLPLTCGDGLDNDGDGLTDLADTGDETYPTSSDGGCLGDADGDGFSDLTEIDALSRPYASVGAASQPEDISVAGTHCDSADNLDQDGDGDMDDDGFGIFVPADTGCLDADSDGHSDAREAAFGSNPDDDTSTPENLLVKPTSTHVCSDGIDNDGDGLTDVGTATTTGDDGCRIMVRTDMNKAFTGAAGTDVTAAIEQCRTDFDGTSAFDNTPVTVHYRIENATPLFAFGTVEVLYDSGQLKVTTGVSGASAAANSAGIVDFWTKNGAAAPTSFDDGVPDLDGRWTGVIVSDLGLTGPTGNGAVAEFAFTTLANTSSLAAGATSVISIDPSATTFIIRSQKGGTITADGGIPRNNPHSIVPGAIYFDSTLAAAGSPCPSDADGDGVDDRVDNCGAIANADQADNDFDSYSSTTPPTVSDSGDVCDTDDDNDGETDADENTFGSDPFNPGSTPEHLSVSGTCSDGVDNDKDDLIDSADPGCLAPDKDGDGVPDDVDDCPNDADNDKDSDGICGDVDDCPNDADDDKDSDGLCGDVDPCPNDSNNADKDSDLVCDDVDDCPNDADNDKDSDGLCGDVDDCPNDADNDKDTDGVCGDIDPCPNDAVDADKDQDGICDDVDDCPNDADNDKDSDGLCGDVDDCPNDADNDKDSDGRCGDVDDCPNDADDDKDGDGVCGDVDPFPNDPDDDKDGDGISGDVDSCPNDADNDKDADGQCGDVDPCPNDADNDKDADGFCGDVDNCPDTANSGQEDQDGDGIGDACDEDKDDDDVLNADDNCPDAFNPDQADQDGDKIGDACDTDKDGDGVDNTADNCVNTANSDQADQDGDGAGDACDDDKDGDGVDNASDQCPGTAEGVSVDADGCSTAQLAAIAGPTPTPTGVAGATQLPASGSRPGGQDNAWILLALGGLFLAVGAATAARIRRGRRAGP